MADDLASLRRQLDEVDRAILENVARRREIVRGIAEAKDGTHPLFDRERERAVYERAEGMAEGLGLDAGLIRAVMGVLVEESHRIQERVSIERARSETPHDFLIIGGAGRMGRRLGGDLAARGHSVESFDLDDERDLATLISAADIVMIAVPMSEAVRVAGAVAPLVRPDALLCDINSLKADVCAAMEDGASGEVLGLHPMFGPTVHSLRRQKVVACRRRTGPLSDWLLAEFGRMGLDVVEADPDAHDRMMAVVQVLVHFSTIVMGEALRRCGETLGAEVEESLRFTSPIYRLELAFVGRLFAQDPALYAEIVMTNPHGARARADYREAVESITRAVDAGDRAAFAELFTGTRSYFHGFAEEAMRLSDHIIDSLVRQP